MESFTSDTSFRETIIVKRNATGHIVVIHSDWHPDELVPFRFGLHRWGLVDPTRNCIVVIHPEVEMIIEEGFIAVGGRLWSNNSDGNKMRQVRQCATAKRR